MLISAFCRVTLCIIWRPFFRPSCDPQMIRFGAHVVLVLRYLLGDEMKDAFKEKLTTVGDYILQMYVLSTCTPIILLQVF